MFSSSILQDFFARLLERDGLTRADAARGRFRTYLPAAFRHFRMDEPDGARKLTGGQVAFSLDDEPAERRFP